jgi:ribosomal protein S18 acetylase RimI-like enzyme
VLGDRLADPPVVARERDPADVLLIRHALGVTVPAVIAYREDPDVDLEALAALRATCEFAARPRDFLAQQVAGARWLVHAYDRDRLCGFARAISDGVTNAYISSVMVAPDLRRRGIGRAMIERLVADRPHVRFVLHTRRDAVAFYTALGFGPAVDMLVRERSAV